MNERKKLSDILRNNDRDKLRKAFEQTQAADDFTLLPRGEYVCRVLSGELFNAKNEKQTPGFKLVFEVSEGDYEDRKIWHDLWLTGQALPMSKRDLLKLGVTDLEQLEEPLPSGILAKVKLTIRKGDDGIERNHVSAFDVIGIEPADAFEPKDDEAENEQTEADASQSETSRRNLFGGANGTLNRAERL